MGKESYTVITSYEIFDDNQGVSLKISPDSDGFDIVEITTPNAPSVDVLGKADLRISSAMARRIAEVLMKAADDIQNQEENDTGSGYMK